MIEINHALLSEEALDNLIIDIITRQATDYGDYELAIENKKKQLLSQLTTGKAKIIFCPAEEACNIIKTEDWKVIQAQTRTANGF